MTHLSQKTAILFFANSVDKETQRKDLLNGQKNKDFLALLHQKSLQTLKTTCLPVFHFSEKDQIGETFGERIVNAFESVFTQGYENVVCVGSDCPELAVSDIHRTVEALEFSDLVLGPDFRGGVFLIGLNKKAFDKQQWIALSWNQPSLINSFIGYGISFNVHFLEAKFDLNFGSELLYYAIVSPVLQKLLKLIMVVEKPLVQLEHYYFYNAANAEYLRGPPHAA